MKMSQHAALILGGLAGAVAIAVAANAATAISQGRDVANRILRSRETADQQIRIYSRTVDEFRQIACRGVDSKDAAGWEACGRTGSATAWVAAGYAADLAISQKYR